MESSHTAELDIPELNAAASKAHVFPGMADHSLLSVGQLCDEGYIVAFKHATKCSVEMPENHRSQYALKAFLPALLLSYTVYVLYCRCNRLSVACTTWLTNCPWVKCLASLVLGGIGNQ
jgi:hypothetical protein